MKNHKLQRRIRQFKNQLFNEIGYYDGYEFETYIHEIWHDSNKMVITLRFSADDEDIENIQRIAEENKISFESIRVDPLFDNEIIIKNISAKN